MSMKLTEKNICKLNEISSFLAVRDVEHITGEDLENRYGLRKADLIILLGNSILYSVEVAARALNSGAAEKILISGGIGHSTDYLTANIEKSRYKGIETWGRAEADILKDILVKYFSIKDENILIENKSTNCGSNAKEALKAVQQSGEKPGSVILIQDPTMQRRTFASFQKEWRDAGQVTFINYAPFIPVLHCEEKGAGFVEKNIDGIWDMERFLSLVMGEIPRLRDDENGYGPAGKGFIAHMDIPQDVLEAYECLRSEYGEVLR